MALNLGRGSVAAGEALTDDERLVMDEIARRRDELVALASDLIGFDTTAREQNYDPPRDEAARQMYLAACLPASRA